MYEFQAGGGGRFNEAVKRNAKRLSAEFMSRLTAQESENLR